MLKRSLFLLFYFAFFIAIPIAVYYLWPAQNDFVSRDDLGPYPEEFTEVDSMVETYNASFASMFRLIHALTAAGICFLVSVVFAFILSIWKFCRPRKKFEGIILGILIFNILYVPVYSAVLYLFFSFFATLIVYGAVFMNSDLRPVTYTVVALFIFTISFLIAGTVRERRLKKTSPYD